MRPALQLQLESERQLWQTSTFEPYRPTDQPQMLAEGVKLLIGPHIFPNACFYTTISTSKAPRRSSLATLQQILDPQERGKVLQLLTGSSAKKDTLLGRRPVWFCLDGPEGEAFLVPSYGTVEPLNANDLCFTFSLMHLSSEKANPRIMIILKGVTDELHRALQDYLRDPVRLASECLPDEQLVEWNVAFKETNPVFHPPPGLLESLHKAVKVNNIPVGGKRKRKLVKKEDLEGDSAPPVMPVQPTAPVAPLVRVPLKKRKYLPIMKTEKES